MPSSVTVSHRAAGWGTPPSAFPFPCFTLPSFGLFTAESVGHILLGLPPCPALAWHKLQLPARLRDEALHSVPGHHIPAPSGDQAALGARRILQRDSPACCAHTALLLLHPGPQECWDSTTGSFPAHQNGICSIDPAEALPGLFPQLKVTVPCSASAQQHIFDGLALQNFHG